jgi:ELWxxDGT repeat protein
LATLKLPRRKFLHLATGAAALPAVSRFANAQSYPTRPVRLIVPVAPAGANDITARLIGQWLSERLGQQFVIDNRPGGGANIGTEAVVHAPADGYTLLMVGTHEIPVNGAYLDGRLNPHDLTVFNHQVLFNGTDAAGTQGLWVTDGTTAGTHEIAGIDGANLNGLNPSDLTVLGAPGFAPDSPTGSMGNSGSTSQLVQAMAGFGGGAADTSASAPLSADTSQQSFLTTPQHA